MTKAPTPGPWTFDSGETIKIRDAHGGAVATMNFLGHMGKFGGRRKFETVRANADLIAAAPELYAALEGVLELYTRLASSGDCGFWDPEEEPEVIASRNALSKARGEA